MNVHAVTYDVIPDDKQLDQWAALTRLVDRFHLRFPAKNAAEVYRITQALLQRSAVQDNLVMHDHLDVAFLLSLPTVQCGHRSPPIEAVRDKFPRLTIGASVHSVQEAKEAEKAGADYVLFGHIFPTASKAGRPAQGLARLKEVVINVGVPVIAIGGITPARLPKIAATGAQGVAIQSGIFRANSPLETARAYVEQARRNAS